MKTKLQLATVENNRRVLTTMNVVPMEQTEKAMLVEMFGLHHVLRPTGDGAWMVEARWKTERAARKDYKIWSSR